MSGLTSEAIRRLIRFSALLGVRGRFEQSLLEIEHALRHQPTTWGRAHETLSTLRIVQYRHVHDSLLVRYAVHMDTPDVWLMGVAPMPGSCVWAGEG